MSNLRPKIRLDVAAADGLQSLVSYIENTLADHLDAGIFIISLCDRCNDWLKQQAYIAEIRKVI